MEGIFQNQYFWIIIKAVGIILFAIILKKVFSFYFLGILKKTEKKEPSEEKRLKKTRMKFIDGFFSFLIYSVAIIFVLFLIPGFKEISVSLLAGAGIAAVVLGFAAQKSLANIISGISIAFYAPFRVGDKLKIFGEYGIVEDISLRHTIIRTWDNKRLVIPNSLIDSQEILNFSLRGERVLWTLNFGISYDSNIDKAKKIMIEKANKHPDNLVFKDEKGIKNQPFVRVTECGDFAVNLRLYFWSEDAWTAWKMGYDLTEEIKKEFDKKGIEIPFPYRTIVYKKDLEKRKK